MRRKVKITLTGDISLTGDVVVYEFNDDTYKIFGRALELMHICRGDRTQVGFILQAENCADGMQMKGYIDCALATFIDPTNFIVLEISRNYDNIIPAIG